MSPRLPLPQGSHIPRSPHVPQSTAFVPAAPCIPKTPLFSGFPCPHTPHCQSVGKALTSALQLGVSPVILLALGTDTATKAEVAAALPCDLQREQGAQPTHSHPRRTQDPYWDAHLVASGVRGVHGMASTRLAALRPPQVPEVGCTAVAAPAHHIGSAGAGSRSAVTAAGASGAVGRQRSPRVTAAAYGWWAAMWGRGLSLTPPQDLAGPQPPAQLTATAALQGIAEIAGLALGAAGPGSVVQAAAAVPCVRVTGPRVAGVDVVVALAGPAHSSLHLRHPKVARGAAVAAGPCGDVWCG